MTKELFSFIKCLIEDTDLGSHLEVLFVPQDFVESLCQMIKQRPILETGPTSEE